MSKSYEVKLHVWGAFGGVDYDIKPGTHTPKSKEDIAMFEHLVEIGRAEPASPTARKRVKRGDWA